MCPAQLARSRQPRPRWLGRQRQGWQRRRVEASVRRMAGREPSMEDILASIKKVIAEEKDMRSAPVQPEAAPAGQLIDDDEVLELHEPLAPPMDLGPPLVDQQAAETSRHSLE